MSLAGKMEEQSLMKHDTQAAALCTSRSTPARTADTQAPASESVRPPNLRAYRPSIRYDTVTAIICQRTDTNTYL